MRIAVLTLLLASPLLAGEELAQSVEQWRSGDTAERDAASRKAEVAMRRLLAPLLKAVDDPDPEVSRRARQTLRSLVPEEPATERPTSELERRQAEIMRLQAMAAAVAAQAQAAANARQGKGLEDARKELEKLRRDVDRVKREQAEAAWRALAAGEAAARERAEMAGLANQVQQALGVKLSDTRKGPKVTEVTQGGMAHKLGVVPGDLLVDLDGVRVLNVAQLVKRLGKQPDWSRVRLRISRDGTLLQLPAR